MMSLDTLFKQIFLAEQKLNEQTQRNEEAKLAISKCNEKIKSLSEKSKNANEELDKRAQQLSMMRMQCDAMKKCQDQMLKQIEELLCQKRQLSDRLAKIKMEGKKVQEEFLEEISGFNSDFSLGGGGEEWSSSRKQTEAMELDREAEMLNTEMELMSSSDRWLISVREQKRRLQVEQQDLDAVQTDLERQLAGAQAATQLLRVEQQFVSHKPQTDRTCLRLRDELESFDNSLLELQRETLNSEIHFLKSKLDASQRSEQH